MASKKPAAKTAAAPAAGPAVAGLNMALLAAIVAATNANSYVHTAESDHAPMVAQGLVEVNMDPQFADAEGKKATRATPAGIAAVGSAASAFGGASAPVATDQAAANSHVTQGATATPTKMTFEIVNNVPIPDSQRRGVQRTESYPFGKLEVGQSFFIPASDDKPQPERSYASTVASARQRYAKPDGAQTRTNRKGRTVPVQTFERDFAIRAVADGAAFGKPGVKGAAVWRTK